MIEKGDIVKVVPRNYFDLCKGFFNYPNRWESADPKNNEVVMLGGQYKVLDEHSEKSGKYFKLIEKGLNNQDMVHESFVVLSGSVTVCPFLVGDKVVFDLSLDEARKNMSIFQYYDYGNGVHQITAILNDYYIFIDVPKDDPYSFPFRWTDFKRKE